MSCTAGLSPPLDIKGSVGLHPTDLQGLHLPSFKTEESPGVSNRIINGSMDAGAYTSEAKSWSDDTPPRVVDGQQDTVVIFSGGGRGRRDYQLEGD